MKPAFVNARSKVVEEMPAARARGLKRATHAEKAGVCTGIRSGAVDAVLGDCAVLAQPARLKLPKTDKNSRLFKII